MDNNKIIGITDETLVPLEPLENTQNIEIIKKDMKLIITQLIMRKKSYLY